MITFDFNYSTPSYSAPKAYYKNIIYDDLKTIITRCNLQYVTMYTSGLETWLRVACSRSITTNNYVDLQTYVYRSFAALTRSNYDFQRNLYYKSTKSDFIIFAMFTAMQRNNVLPHYLYTIVRPYYSNALHTSIRRPIAYGGISPLITRIDYEIPYG